MNKIDLTNNSEITDICRDIANVYKKEMREAGYNPAGELMNFNWTTEFHGTTFYLYFILPDYFQYAENGRKAGKMPPVNEILKWIQIKHLVPSTRNGKVPTTNQLAFAISKKIAEKGTKGKHLLQDTIDYTYDRQVDELVECFTNLFEKQIDKDLENINIMTNDRQNVRR